MEKDRLTNIEQRVGKIEERNRLVENDKAWEKSWTRRIVVATLTYLAIGIYFFMIDIERPWLNAIVPAIGFMLSTLTLPIFKSIWLKFKN